MAGMQHQGRCRSVPGEGGGGGGGSGCPAGGGWFCVVYRNPAPLTGHISCIPQKPADAAQGRTAGMQHQGRCRSVPGEGGGGVGRPCVPCGGWVVLCGVSKPCPV